MKVFFISPYKYPSSNKEIIAPIKKLTHTLVLLFNIIWYELSNTAIISNRSGKIILGIDPGTIVMGYGLISVDKNSVTLVEMGVLQLKKYSDHAERLQLIFKKVEGLIKNHNPVAVAIEAPFFGKNVQSMLKLGRAQGVAIAAAMMHGLHAHEYAPRKVKQSVTGRGNATKEQVWSILQHTFKLPAEDVRFMDATDAVAVALCHFYQNKIILPVTEESQIKPIKGKKSNSWESFLQQNPQRVKN